MHSGSGLMEAKAGWGRRRVLFLAGGGSEGVDQWLRGGASVLHRKEGRRPEVPSHRAAALTDLIKRKETRGAAEPS